jgi:type I restriction-modification system DNA methylase subunit
MRPQSLQEFAQELRRGGDIRQADMADEILALIDIEEEIAEPYGNLCSDIEHYAKSNPDDAAKALEWLGDRSNLLKEIEEELAEDGRTGDTDDVVRELLGEIDDIKMALKMHGFELDEFFEAITKPEASLKVEYDL